MDAGSLYKKLLNCRSAAVGFEFWALATIRRTVPQGLRTLTGVRWSLSLTTIKRRLSIYVGGT